MSARPMKPTLGRGIVAALVLALVGGAVLATLAPFAGTGTAARIVVAGLGLAYVLYLLAGSGERVGRLTTVAVWLGVAALAWFAWLPFALYVLVHVGMLWLVRSLYYYSSVLAAAVDLGLTFLGVAFAVWAAGRSGSAWLAFWCFFLAQAFHVLIPAKLQQRDPRAARGGADPFANAHRAAEAALRRLTTVQ